MSVRSDLTTRIVDLKESEGLSFQQIANLLAGEGVVGRNNQPLNISSVKARYYDYKKKPSSNEVTTTPEGMTTSQSSYTKEKPQNRRKTKAITNADLEQLKGHLEDYVRNLVQEAVASSPPPSSHTQEESRHTNEIRILVQQEITKLLGDIRVEQVQKSGRGGTPQTVKKTVSIPLDVYAAIKELGGIFSNHATAALRVYLKILKEENQ